MSLCDVAFCQMTPIGGHSCLNFGTVKCVRETENVGLQKLGQALQFVDFPVCFSTLNLRSFRRSMSLTASDIQPMSDRFISLFCIDISMEI